jgi:DnaJ-class molecular chaperone
MAINPQETSLAADPYTVLGVKKDASQDGIQKAYRRLAKRLHPGSQLGQQAGRMMLTFL